MQQVNAKYASNEGGQNLPPPKKYCEYSFPAFSKNFKTLEIKAFLAM